MIKELERVVLTEPLPAEGLETGDVGTVVHAYHDGEAFEVEFTTLDGHTAAVVTTSHPAVSRTSAPRLPRFSSSLAFTASRFTQPAVRESSQRSPHRHPRITSSLLPRSVFASLFLSCWRPRHPHVPAPLPVACGGPMPMSGRYEPW